MMNPKLSVIIPVYNAEDTLERCVDSVLQQTFSDYEIIIIDDGSSDCSGKICDLYVVQDKRIHVIHQKNCGVSAARNAGIDAACGQYIMFIDSDDEIKQSFLKDYVVAIEKMDCDVIIGGYTKIKADGSRTVQLPIKDGVCQSETWEYICKYPEQFGYLWNKLFRRDIVQKAELRLRADLYSQEDLDFCLSYFRYCSQFGFVSNKDYQYYYKVGKRKPPIWNYIENQIKLIELAKINEGLSEEAEMAVINRIFLLLFTFLYSADTHAKFDEAIERLECVDGLRNHIRNKKVCNEKSFIAWLFIRKQYKVIYVYFKTRNSIRDIVRKLRSSL